MTKQEHFKRRIRARMAKTGERYGAARRALIDHSDAPHDAPARARMAPPEVGDDVVRTKTGRDWDEWCDLINAWEGHRAGHTAVARYLESQHDVTAWWAQAITVGWERITGRRQVNQLADGTFEARKTRTIDIDAVELRSALTDDAGRADLFPGIVTEMRSRPTTKSPRVAFPEGIALFSLTELPNGRVRVNVTHGRLVDPSAVEFWKAYWTEWLEALEASVMS